MLSTSQTKQRLHVTAGTLWTIMPKSSQQHDSRKPCNKLKLDYQNYLVATMNQLPLPPTLEGLSNSGSFLKVSGAWLPFSSFPFLMRL